MDIIKNKFLNSFYNNCLLVTSIGRGVFVSPNWGISSAFRDSTTVDRCLLPDEHLLAALLQFFYFILYVSCELAGFSAGLRHGFLHGFGGLIA